MRLRSAFLAGFLVLLLGTLGFAQPAAASPATPFSFGGWVDLGDGFSYSFAVNGVSQGNYARAGNLKVTVNAKVDYTFMYEGQAVIAQRVNFHFNAHFKQGEPQVVQQNQRSSFTFTGAIAGTGITFSCSYTSSVMYANGAMRHDLSDYWCA